MTAILLHADRDRAYPARLALAHDLATALNAHVQACFCLPIYVPSGTEMLGVVSADIMTKRVLEIEQEQAAASKAKAEAALGDLGGRLTWAERMGDDALVLAELSRFADIIVAGPHDPPGEGPATKTIVGALLSKASAPVIVPSLSKGYRADAPVLVGWNGSGEAARAVKAALPLLKLAPVVHVLSIEERHRDSVPGADVARYLAGHGVRVETQTLSTSADPSASLFANAETLGAGLLVIGAYSRPRLFELVFGGVTRDVLAHPPLPVLLRG
jgi:nucleotide-binding universal stress UspA family protein